VFQDQDLLVEVVVEVAVFQDQDLLVEVVEVFLYFVVLPYEILRQLFFLELVPC
jgi:hypothetical protein